MDDPDWAKVLQTIYTQNGELYREAKGSLSKSDELVIESELEPNSVERALVFLRENDLIATEWAGQTETESGEKQATHMKYSLTRKGFNVAHERELSKSRQKTNLKSTRLSAYLVIAIVIQSLIAISQHEGGLEVVVLSMIIMGVVIVVLVELNEEYLEKRLDDWT